MVSSFQFKLDAKLILDSIRFVIRAYCLLKVKPPKIWRWYVIMAYGLFKNIPFWEYCGPSVRVLGWKGLDIGKTVKKKIALN